MSTVEERVKKIVCEQLGVKESEVQNTSSFVEDLGADSLDTVEEAGLRSGRNRLYCRAYLILSRSDSQAKSRPLGFLKDGFFIG